MSEHTTRRQWLGGAALAAAAAAAGAADAQPRMTADDLVRTVKCARVFASGSPLRVLALA
jgi:hypothetical protein